MKREQIPQFIKKLMEVCRSSKGDAARLRCADVPSQAVRCWSVMARLGVYPDSPDFPACTCVAAAVASLKDYHNGRFGLGQALRLACRDKNTGTLPDTAGEGINSPDSIRLRRLLSCDSLEELTAVLRPMIRLIQSKNTELDYEKLLRDLNTFRFSQDQVKKIWASEFFRRAEENESDKSAAAEACA